MRTHVLFVCSRNKWRSPTGERVFSRDPNLAVRSAGTSPRAKRTVNANDIMWADLILVMEPKHKQRLQATFARPMQYKAIHVLDIPDDYQFMDDELVALFESLVPPLLPTAAG